MDDAVGFNVNVASRGSQAGNRLADCFTARQPQDAHVAEALKLLVDEHALAGFRGLDGSVIRRIARPGEDRRISVTLGQFFRGKALVTVNSTSRGKSQQSPTQGEQAKDRLQSKKYKL